MIVRALMLVLLTTVAAAAHQPRSLREILDRAMADFQAGRIAASIDGFDRVMTLQRTPRRSYGSAALPFTMRAAFRSVARSSSRTGP